jgi:hypothetical protein
MRIAVTSDMHLPKSPAEVIEGVASEIAVFDAAVVLAGDLGESSADFEPCLDLFSRCVSSAGQKGGPGW